MIGLKLLILKQKWIIKRVESGGKIFVCKTKWRSSTLLARSQFKVIMKKKIYICDFCGSYWGKSKICSVCGIGPKIVMGSKNDYRRTKEFQMTWETKSKRIHKRITAFEGLGIS